MKNYWSLLSRTMQSLYLLKIWNYKSLYTISRMRCLQFAPLNASFRWHQDKLCNLKIQINLKNFRDFTNSHQPNESQKSSDLGVNPKEDRSVAKSGINISQMCSPYYSWWISRLGDIFQWLHSYYWVTSIYIYNACKRLWCKEDSNRGNWKKTRELKEAYTSPGR